ncbi:MAG: hypothetical protein PHC61_17400 [Chitinivibrionales bacterium]|nr:hypothetical protein [Chitinivibrionales bacterium]
MSEPFKSAKIVLKSPLFFMFVGLCMSQIQAAPPARAVAAGFTVNTFSSTFDSTQVDMKNSLATGFKWYLSQFFDWGVIPASQIKLNSDASATISTSGITINQWLYPYDGSGVPDYTYTGLQSAGKKVVGTDTSWVGTVFGGGGYFEVTVKINAPHYPDGGPSCWLMSIEKMANLPSLHWPGQAVGYQHFSEIDMFDFHDVVAPQYRAFVRELYGTLPMYNIAQTSNFPHCYINFPANNDLTASHKYAFIWVPATADKTGYVTFFYDDKAMGDSVSWSKYANQAAPPADPWRLGFLDTQHLVMVLGDTYTPGMTVQLVNVWQKADNTGGKDNVIPVTLPAMTSQTVATSLPAAGKSVANNALSYAIDKGNLIVTVGLTGPHALEIVRPDGSVATRFFGTNSAKYFLNHKMLPAGIYMLRAIAVSGNKAAKLLVWY